VAISIDEEGDLLKREKRNSERQFDRTTGEPGKIFVVAKNSEVSSDGEREESFWVLCARAPDSEAEGIVKKDRGTQEDQVSRIPPGVKEKRSGDQEQLSR
jgi:hypothetical protein